MNMFEAITAMVSSTMGSVLAPVVAMGPTVSIFVVASLISIIVTGVNKAFIYNDTVKGIKKEMKEIQNKMKDAQKNGNSDKTDELFSRMMEINTEFMKHSYKSMFVSLIIVSLFLSWIRAEYSGMTVAQMPFNMPLLGSELGCISWYILVSFTMGWVIRKVLGFD